MLGRAYRRGVHVPLREAIERHERGQVPLFVLFPGWGARGADEAGEALRDGRIGWSAEREKWEWAEDAGAEREDRADEQAAAASGDEPAAPVTGSEPVVPAPGSAPSPSSLPLYSLLAFDATWPHGKEMATKIFPNLPDDVIHIEIRGARIDPKKREAQGAGEAQEEHAVPQAEAQEERTSPQAGAQDERTSPQAGVQEERTSPQAEAQSAAEAGDERGLDGGVERGDDAAAARSPPGPSEAVARLNLRVEPIAGLLTTAEAVSRALAALEPVEGKAGRSFSRLERALDDPTTAPEWVLAALAGWVEQGSKWDPALRARAEGGDAIKRTPSARKPKAKLRPSQEEGDRIALERKRERGAKTHEE